MALKQPNAPTSLPFAAYAGGLALVLLGERVLSSVDAARIGLSALGLTAVVASAALRFVGAARGSGDRKQVDRGLGVLTLVSLVALAVMFASTDAGERLLGLASKAAPARARFEGLATVLWVSTLLGSMLPLVFAEVALVPVRRAEQIEKRRILAAGLAGLTVALAATYGALFTYAAGELEMKVDFSYFRTARPSESTRNVAASATEGIKVVAFFPQLNEVGREVGGYLLELSHGVPGFAVELQDRLLVPSLAKELKVTTDGVVVLSRGKVREAMTIGTDMTAARAKLKTLDGDFQKALLKVLREQKIAYLTTGHGELNEATTSAEGRSATAVKKLLESQSYLVKDLGLTQGLGAEVPSDASVVIVLGPAQPLLPGEIDSLRRYAERGGHLLLALDPEAKADLDPLAAIAGLSWDKATLVNEKVHLVKSHNDSDRAILATNRYSSHASVSTLSRNSARAPIVLPGVSSLDKRAGADAALKIDFAVKTMPDTFADADGDFRYGAQEKKTTWNVGAAVSRAVTGAAPAGKDKAQPEMRAFVLADADAFSDAAFANEPNVLFFIDAVRWLGGEESFTGAISTTEDVKIEHTKQKDLVWFYTTILGMPGLVLGLGLAYARRSRRTPPRGQA